VSSNGVVKNTLVKQALKDKAWGKAVSPDPHADDRHRLSYEDPSAAASRQSLPQDNEKLRIKARPHRGQLSMARRSRPARHMPGKQELRAQLLATLQAPLQKFVALLEAPSQNFRYVLSAKERRGNRTGPRTYTFFTWSEREALKRQEVRTSQHIESLKRTGVYHG